MNRAQRKRRIKAIHQSAAKRRGVVRIIDKSGAVLYPSWWQRLLGAIKVR